MPRRAARLPRLAALSLLACAGIAPTLPAAAAPAMQADGASRPLVLERWFAGRSHATGTFTAGMVGKDRGITANFVGRRVGGTFVLIEDIAYSDGEKARKEWHFTRTGPGSYIGLRDDVVGRAVGTTDAQGRLHLVYTATMNGHDLAFDDILALQPDGTVINTSTVSYLFLHVGDVELHFRKGR